MIRGTDVFDSKVARFLLASEFFNSIDPERTFSSREGREKRGPRKPERTACEANGFDV